MCCGRLVASARPSRQHQEAMLAAIARYPKAPQREAVLACLKATYLERHLAQQNAKLQRFL
jgi:hypothetical protein